ncbi:dipeptidase [Myxococcota bacterium]
MQIDLHADTPLLMQWLGYNFCRRHRPWFPGGAWVSNLDLPRMEEGGLDAQLFGLVGVPIEPDSFGTINEMIDRLERAERDAEGRFVLVRSAGELREARARGARAGMLSLEGAHALRGSIDRAAWLLQRGVISFGLAHLHANEACSPAYGLGKDRGQGLTEFGRELVAYLGHHGAMVDLAHINRKGFFEAVYHATGPIFVSHTGVCGVKRHSRNIDDEQIQAIADRGGVVGVIFSRGFLGGSDLGTLVRHVQHIIKVGGEEVAALGSDFDGWVVPPRGLKDVRGLPALRQALSDAGLTARQVDGVMGDNAMALFERALG